MGQQVKKGWKGTPRAWTRWVIARRPCDVRELLLLYFCPVTVDVDPGGPFAGQPVIRRIRNTVRITQRGGVDD